MAKICDFRLYMRKYHRIALILMRKSAESGWTQIESADIRAEVSFVNGFKHAARKGLCCRFHQHPVVEIVYHRSGSGVTRLATGDTLAFGEGSYIIYPPGLQHDQVMELPGEDLCVQVDLPSVIFCPDDGCLHVARADRWVHDTFDALTEGRGQTADLERKILDFRASAVLLELLRLRNLSSGEPNRKVDGDILRAEDYIRIHFHELRSLGEVAAYVGLSHDRLRHIYKAERGISLVQFLIQIRMERAKSLLSTSNMSLKQIAPLCGYQDSYYFSAAFRRAVGVNPSDYRGEQTTIGAEYPVLESSS